MDNEGDSEDVVSQVTERERRELQRAPLLDCLRVAVTYDQEEEINPGGCGVRREGSSK